MADMLNAAADGVTVARFEARWRASRRRALTLAGAGVLAGLAAACGRGGGASARDGGEEPGDFAIGDPNAPVTIVEYASVTCSHCATFHRTTFKELKSRYIETGKVRFIFRELPTPPANLAVAGFVLARCAGRDRYFDVIDVLFDRQEAIFRALQAGTQRDLYVSIARNAGLSEDQFNACLGDEAMINAVYDSAERASAEHNITGTPSFLINGQLTPGLRTIEQFEDAMAAYLDAPAPPPAPDNASTPAAETTPAAAPGDAAADASADGAPPAGDAPEAAEAAGED